jgi:hypothetical protein
MEKEIRGKEMNTHTHTHTHTHTKEKDEQWAVALPMSQLLGRLR